MVVVVNDSYRRLLFSETEYEDEDEDEEVRILSGVRGYKIKIVKFETQFIIVDI